MEDGRGSRSREAVTQKRATWTLKNPLKDRGEAVEGGS